MIKGVDNQKPIPYVLDDDRSSEINDQTIFWIKPKTGSDNNKTVRRYAATSKENRKGYREIQSSKLDAADQDEFLSVVTKVEHYGFPQGSKFFNDGKPSSVLESSEELLEVARTLSADHLAEVLEVSNNISKLTDGAKKNSSF